jgi:TolB-like protein/class 3 adenylate cyclase
MPASTKERTGRRLAAILFADVAGSSIAMARDEDRTIDWIRRSIALIKSLIGDYGGRVVHYAGDGVLAIFNSAGEALTFAVEIQRELRNDAVWNTAAQPLAFRMGINLGEVLEAENDIYGQSVNVAARIQEVAPPGGICVSDTVRDVVRARSELRLQSLGHPALKNIEERIEIFAVESLSGSAGEFVLPRPTATPLIESASEASVAVLPLRNLSGDPSDEHLCMGITSDIITDLSRFRDLLVIARHSTFLFRDSNQPGHEIARQLGVCYLMTGGLQRVGNRLRLRVELAEVAAGRVIWGEHYHGDLGDLFAFQDDVANMIAARLAIQISSAERRRMRLLQIPNLRAYGLVLRGQDLSLRHRKEAVLHARRLFEQAAQFDPDYGRTYAGMSRTFNLEWRHRWADNPEACIDHAVKLAHRAVEHDQLDARGYAELGFAQLYKKQHDASLAAYERAIEINPNDADILAEMADCVTCSNAPGRAVDLLQRAMRLNPYYPDFYLWNLGEALFDLERYEGVIATLNKMQDKSEAHRLLASSHALLGNMDEARHHARQVLIAHPDFSLAHWLSVPPTRNEKHLERYFEGLKLAGLK